jgi:VanZ family protein
VNEAKSQMNGGASSGSEDGTRSRAPSPQARNPRSRWRWLPPALFALMIGLLVLHPYEFAPDNDVARLPGEPGLFFGGNGLAYTEHRLDEIAGAPLDELTLELWLRLPENSTNYGARMILSIHDPRYELPLCLGQWGDRLFLFVPSETWTTPWFGQLILDERIPKEQDQFVAAVVSSQSRSLILADQELRHEAFSSPPGTPPELSRRLILGASPGGRYRWHGELSGLALYDRALTPEEIEGHRVGVEEQGLASLATADHLLALFPFHEPLAGESSAESAEGGGEEDAAAGGIAQSLAPGKATIRVPARFSALPEVLLDRPNLGRLQSPMYSGDVMRNILLFVPFGWLLLIAAGRHSTHSWLALVAGVTLAGCLLSLSLEALQLLLPSRATTLADLIANSLGTVIGALAAVGGGMLRVPHPPAR